jgi:hypothetical protein
MITNHGGTETRTINCSFSSWCYNYYTMEDSEALAKKDDGSTSVEHRISSNLQPLKDVDITSMYIYIYIHTHTKLDMQYVLGSSMATDRSF